METLPPNFFQRDPEVVAPDLIGVLLLVDGVGGRIVETEAYDRQDPASHSFNGRTARNASMFGPVGHAYVYRSYGLHWCLNVVCGATTSGGAVLIRALEPIEGIDRMQARRSTLALRQLCRGPGRLCQALDVSKAHDGAPMDKPPFALKGRDATSLDVAAGRRIGISRGVEALWRFGLSGSVFLSCPLSN